MKVKIITKYILFLSIILLSGVLLFGNQYYGLSSKLNEIPSLSLKGVSIEEWEREGLFVDTEFQLTSALSIRKEKDFLNQVYIPGQTTDTKVYLIGSGTYRQSYHDEENDTITYSDMSIPVFIFFHEGIWQYARGPSELVNKDNYKVYSNGYTIISVDGEFISATAQSAEHLQYDGTPILEIPNVLNK